MYHGFNSLILGITWADVFVFGQNIPHLNIGIQLAGFSLN